MFLYQTFCKEYNIINKVLTVSIITYFNKSWYTKYKICFLHIVIDAWFGYMCMTFMFVESL